MRRRERFEGGGAPFEGDRTIWVRSLPDGAQLTSAVLVLTPVGAPGAPLFEERIAFAGGVGTLGAGLTRNDVGALHWTEVDLHQRRTVTGLRGGTLGGAEVQVDLGGLYVRLNSFGAPLAPADPPLLLGPDGALPGLTVTKIKLTSIHELPVSEVTLRSTPSNLVVRVGSQPSLWSRPGELVVPVSTPDIAAALQQALSGAAVDGGFYRLPIVVHSDTLCRLDVELDVDFTVARPALPGGLTETTLTYDFAGAPDRPAVTLTVPPGGRLVPSPSRARALGAFQASRVGYGPVGPAVAAGSVPLTADQSVAVPVVVPQDLEVTAVDLLLAATTPTARLQLDVVADTDGKPWNRPLLARPVEVSVDRGDDPAARWVSAALPAAFTFRAGIRYWLTLQVVSGEAAWSVVASTAVPATQQSRDGGLSWRQASAPGVPQVAALLRLRVVPSAFTMPVQIEVGAGAGARRVSLQQFAPLGRVEIDLNSPEVIGGINAAVSTTAESACPTGEHVRNGEFSHWGRSADLPTGSRSLDAGFRARRIAVAQDCVAFLAGGAEAGVLEVTPARVLVQLGKIDVFADRAEARTPPLADGRQLSGFAADPAGRYCYALLDGQTLLTLDDRTGQTASATLALLGANAVATSADGTTVFVVAPSNDSENAIKAVVAFPADVVRSGGTSLSGAELHLDDTPLDVVATRDGSTLFVLCDGDGSCSLLGVDPTRLAVRDAPIVLGAGAERIAVSAGGSTVAAVHPSEGKLTLIDVVARVTRQVDLLDDQPSAVSLNADGHYAFVTLASPGAVAVVDTVQGRVVRRVPVGAAPADCVLTSDGERLYVADAIPPGEAAPGTAFTVLTIGSLLPEDWTVTAGTVRPSCLPGGRVALIDGRGGRDDTPSPAATAAMAQVMSVAGGCHYEMTFSGLASAEGATAELHWLGSDCSTARTDTVPLAAVQPRLSRTDSATPNLVAHRLLSDAPSGAAQAELRFQAPAGVAAAVDRVSLHATSTVLPKGALALDGTLLDGWQVTPPAAPGFAAAAAGEELLLRNGAAVEVTVTQHADVSASTTYQLTVDAGTTSGTSSVELEWTSGGRAVGRPVSVPLTVGASRPLLTSVVAPAGVDGGEVRVVLPPGAELRVRRVSLDEIAAARVPVTFVAESPGELTLTGWQVAYDVDETPRVPSPPPGGLCRPGTPERIPGEPSPDRCYCPTCQGDHEMAAPRAMRTATGTPAAAYTCTNCGATVVLPASQGPSLAGTPLALSTQPRSDVGSVLLAAPASAPPPPLAAVNGIGHATATRLNALGIVAMTDLAATPLPRLTALPHISPASARSWIKQARSLTATGESDDVAAGSEDLG